ncbi:EsaB/YukD family protein [Actinomadura darangshiensis]|nr:EsaB/YukD family protein [Actinomadura darangshiensis]
MAWGVVGIAEDLGELCRVTVVGPQRRFDIALPSHIPFASLLPTILEYSGRELADMDAGHDGWVLQRLDEKPFPEDATPAQLSLRHGETLYLRPASATILQPVTADPADLVDPLVSPPERTAPWGRRQAGFTALGTAAVAALAALPLAGAPWWPQAAAAAVLAVLCVGGGGVLIRSGPVGHLLAALAVPFAFLSGLLWTLGDHDLSEIGPAQVATAFGAAALAAALGVAVRASRSLGLLIASGIGGIAAGSAVVFDEASAEGVAALCLAVVLPLAAGVPPFALLLARSRIRLRSLPDSSDESLSARLLERRAAEVLGVEGVLGVAIGLAGVGGEAVLATASGGWERAAGALAAAALFLTAFRYRQGPGRMALLTAGAAGAGIVAVAGAGEGPHWAAAVVPSAVLLVMGAIAVAATLAGPARPEESRLIRPVALLPRALDVLNAVVLLALLTLALYLAGAR